MCYPDRSLEQATSTCSMCKVFPPRNNYSCPHKDSMGVCKNRTNHPRHDVVHFRNAELSSFNGCGFCKWAKRNPKILVGDAAWRNPGWPGCCRPPKSNEYEYINGADWYAISKIHGILVPTSGSPPSPHTSPNKSPNNSPPSRSKSIISPRGLERRDSGSRDPASSPARDPTAGFPNPKVDSESRRRSSSDVSRKADSLAPVRAPVVTRENSSLTRSPNRQSVSVSSRKESEVERVKASPEDKDREKDRRTKSSTADNPYSTIRGPPPNLSTPAPPPRPSNPIPKSSASSDSSSSSGSCSSITQSGTVTSEGFTDYLSDDSEVEMQREAERRAGEAELAAKLERTKIELGREEQEFRAARSQLASLGLQPPPVWSSGKLTAPTGKSSESASHTSFPASGRPNRSPGNLSYGSHSTSSAPSFVQVYSSTRQ